MNSFTYCSPGSDGRLSRARRRLVLLASTLSHKSVSMAPGERQLSSGLQPLGKRYNTDRGSGIENRPLLL